MMVLRQELSGPRLACSELLASRVLCDRKAGGKSLIASQAGRGRVGYTSGPISLKICATANASQNSCEASIASSTSLLTASLRNRR